jgi:transcriptional regulator with XRE-family HTH domain
MATATETALRDAAGVHINPAALRYWRETGGTTGIGMSRATLARRVGELDWIDPDTGEPLTLQRDSIAKYEHPHPDPRYRRYPRPITLAAICAVLQITPAHLMPGEDVPELPPVTLEREARREFTEGLIAFATERGLPIRNTSGRVYHYRDTVDAYVRYLVASGKNTALDESEARDREILAMRRRQKDKAS